MLPERTWIRDLAADWAGVGVRTLSLEREEGAGKAGCPEHPQPVCIGSKHTVVTTVAPEVSRLSPRNGFNGFLRALLGDEFLLVTVAERIVGDLARLGRFRLRSTWHQQRMPGPHDFAVRSDPNQTPPSAVCGRSKFWPR